MTLAFLLFDDFWLTKWYLMFIDVHREDGTFVLGSFSIRLSIALPVHFVILLCQSLL